MLLSFIFAMLSAAAVCLHHTVSFSRYGSHGVTEAALQGLLLVTATKGASVCVCVCMRACNPEHNEGRFQPTLPLFSKAPAQYSRGTAAAAAAAAVQHQRTSQGSYTSCRHACAPPFQLAIPPGFQVNHISKGNLVPGTISYQVCTTEGIKY